MTQRCRLLVRAHMGDAICEPGHEFALPDGEIGPHRTITHGPDLLDLKNDAARIIPQHEDEPLYEVWDGQRWAKPNTGGMKS